MSNEETTHEQNVLRITRLSGTLFALMDVLIVTSLGFGYVGPFLLDVPDVSLLRVASTVAVVLLIGLLQVFLLPVIMTQFGFKSVE